MPKTATEPKQPELPEDPMPHEEMPGGSTELDLVREASPPTYRGVMSDDELRRTWRIASALAQSGMFPDAKDATKALAKILIGYDLGLSPAQSMSGIHLIEGRPEVGANLLAGFLRSRGGYDYKIIRHTDEECVLMFSYKGEILGESRFSMEDAERAGIKKAKSGWEKYPRNMLFARAMSNGVRWYAPEATGGLPVYTEGEVVPESRRIAGTGEPEGLDLGPKVEEVLIRAQALGHEGIADRATAEMALGSQSPQVVDQWVAAQHAELDKIDPAKQGTERPDEDAPEEPDEPEVVEPDSVEEPKGGKP